MKRSHLAYALTLSITALAANAVGAPFDFASISAGYATTCGVTTAGAAVCWGGNHSGQLGEATMTNRSVPVLVSGLQMGVAAISVGQYHVCALMTSGGVKCWGFNGDGQLGDGTTGNHSIPVDVVGLSGGVASISAGGSTTCAVMTSGALKCWGSDYFGEIGDGSTGLDRTTPSDAGGFSGGVASVSVGYSHTCAVTTGGAAKCWGYNFDGQLGDGTITSSSTPVDVVGLQSDVAAVSAGEWHTCAVTTAGGVKCWGSTYDFLGSVDFGIALTPIDIGELAPVKSPLTGISAVSAGTQISCALTTSGAVKCWPPRYGGNASSWAPDDITGFLGTPIAVDAGELHACVVLADGGAMCWGSNYQGELGIGSIDPLLVATPTSVVRQDFRSAQTIALTPIANRNLDSGPFDSQATSTSGLPVTITSMTPWVCTISGSTVVLVEVGLCTIVASQEGDAQTLSAQPVYETFLVTGLTGSSPTRLANISTRLHVASQDDVGIAGFVIDGHEPKTIVIRVLGPSLAAYGVTDALSVPYVQYSGTPPAIWPYGDPAAIIAKMGLTPPDPREIAILATVAPGAHTVVVYGFNDGGGTALLELYEIDRPDAPLINISTRGSVLTGDGVMIAGFVVNGNTPQTVMVRAIGPSLTAYNIPTALANPMLQLVRMSDHSLIATNDDWGSAANAATVAAGPFAPKNPLESAILITLDPGAYTAIVTGANGGTGVGLVEVYAQ